MAVFYSRAAGVSPLRGLETAMAKRRLRYLVEGAGAWLLFTLFRVLPFDWASAFGGFIGRNIGPYLGLDKRARANLRRAMPDLDPAQIERIVRGMWDNLGRFVAEYPHLSQLQIFEPGGRVEIAGLDEILSKRSDRKRYIFFSAHYGNWEIASRAASQAGFAIAGVYRAANNPIIDRLLARMRGDAELLPKGRGGARHAIAWLKAGNHLSMLIDQKMNDGIPVRFFGRDAMTAPALARLALRFDATVVPVRIVRLKGAHFRLAAETPLALPRSGNSDADTLALMTTANETVERWVREHPEQWLWVHHRWPD
jgi:Kdo2-lipid IVA lauroyltransferase/acyltransferase